jgi:hypothetical protein
MEDDRGYTEYAARPLSNGVAYPSKKDPNLNMKNDERDYANGERNYETKGDSPHDKGIDQSGWKNTPEYKKRKSLGNT